MKNNKKVVIMGFGKLGRALDHILTHKKECCATCAWDIIETGDPKQIYDMKDLKENAYCVFIAVPSKNFNGALEQIKGISHSVPIISCSKGFGDKRKLPIEILQKHFPKNPVGVLSGPMLSDELMKDLPTKATLASKRLKEMKGVRKLFEGTTLSIEISDDIIGTSLYGILKNVYALMLGLSDGFEMGSNFKSCVALQALKEISAIVKHNKGKEKTIFSQSGIADFLATGYSPYSRNYTYGFQKAGDKHDDSRLTEGFENIANVVALAKGVKTPILKNIEAIFIKNANSKATLYELFSS